MKDFNYENESIVNEMEDKLSIIMDKIDNEVNSEYIFLNFEVYNQVKILLEEIDELWRTIINHSENMKNVYYTLINIEDIININIKYYDVESRN
jgi:hypothetical protein